MSKLSQVELALGAGYYHTKFSMVHLPGPLISFIFWKSSLLVQLHVHLYIIFLKSSKTNGHCPLAELQYWPWYWRRVNAE